MKIVNAAQMRDIDNRASSEYGIPSLILMENAGLRTVEVIEEYLGQTQGKKVTIVAGKGNNGGDGLVAARHLINSGVMVDIFILGDEGQLSPDAMINYQILVRMGAKFYALSDDNGLDLLMLSLLSSDLAVDALYGIGFQGALKEFDSRVVSIMNFSKIPVISVDIPSGLEADTGKIHGEAIRASHTVTFALPKLGLLVKPGLDYVGTLTVADISIPLALMQDAGIKNNLIDENWVRPLIRKRDPESHKGTYGHAIIIGGSLGMTGAVMMSAYSALRTGAGLVTAALPESLVPVFSSALMEVMSAPLAETMEASISAEAIPAIENLLGTSSVCAVGPGLSRYTEANRIITFILENAGIPLVIDADGLNALQGNTAILKNRQVPLVLTPHPGEMARLTGKSIDELQSRRIDIARAFAIEHGIILVLKGNRTVVATPGGEVYININGNPGMATAGSGDVLCGIITGLIAQGLKPQDAAIAGVFIHGWSGDLAASRLGERGMVAADLIQGIPEVLKILETS